MTYNAIEYNIEKQTIKITDSYKEKSKREIPKESSKKIEKHCDNFFTLISRFLERAGNDRNDLNMAMNIFFHSLEGNFQKIAIPLKYKESANDFKEKFPLFIALLDTFNFRDGKNFLGIGLGNCEIEDCLVIKKLMKNTLQDIIEDVSSVEFALENIKIGDDNSRKSSEFFEECYKIFGKKFINDIFKTNEESQNPDLGKNILNADIRNPSFTPIVMSVKRAEERGAQV
jgi:hypothetical protein